MIRAALLLAGLSGASGPAIALERIAPDEFLDMMVGRTMNFVAFPEGYPVGTELFLSRTQSLWQFEGGACETGEMIIRANELCFLYESDDDGIPICWAIFADGDRLFVRTGVFGGEMQEVIPAGPGDLSCPATPSV